VPAEGSAISVRASSPDGIIDAHGHIGQWPATYVPYGHAEDMLVSMDRLGIERACLSAFAAVGPDYVRGNDMVADALRRWPDRFTGYAALNPNYPEDTGRELRRCFDELGMRAIKLHCDLHDYPMDGENYREVFEFAEERELTILIHGAMVKDILRQYPHVNVLSAHVGLWDGRSQNDVIELAKSCDNVYLDLAASLSYRGALKRMVDEVGADRIVHGSDFPLMDPGFQLGRVIYADISEEDKRKILRDNAIRLFDL
jgi:predicted TIM-barrel fold metal-dependent hydrolase